jgi:hypothetical protein
MKYREIWKAIVLSIVTLGIYAIVWFVKVKGELNSKGANIPTAWWLLVPVANIWWLWQYALGVEKVTKEKYVAGLVFLMFWSLPIISQAILQTEYNKMSKAPAKAKS